MIISDEQAHMAANLLADGMDHFDSLDGHGVDPDVIERARLAALRAPDAREERITQAKARLLTGLPDSREIASKMVSRVVGDALR